ncbi:glycosyltransferase [Algoriphagus sp. CAU 1675]|uniref:glycosyltransferase n=1 Tax=Algoriphagus sp. CAU 1675 TaxID=3032597 RepID=UPI0023DC9DB3|nr:glycosyltransferase [Algoriphagus sp. CAU 1675]MDF2157626.1 glycosyltransferase [Algoriphagus sp. CAU 1675]
MFFSVIIPVYNRPTELHELLRSLAEQNFRNFEVLVVEDGSIQKSDQVVENFQGEFPLSYYYQENAGQGFARNFGMEKAKGDFFVILDSDVILPPNYLEILDIAILARSLDAFGGPDASRGDFTALQKAMDFAMTSFLTTGGIRGKLKDPSKFQARGFNMGVSRKVFESLGGFVDPNRGEDIEWSLRIKKAGYKLELVADAFVYHKRKNTLASFAKQAFSFGRNRVNVSRFHSGAIKLVHLFPSLFLLFLIGTLAGFISDTLVFQRFLLGFWAGMILLTASFQAKSLWVGILSLVCSIVQLSSYGLGLIYELLIKVSKG